ncbi:MAG: cytochrome o ubiquinol oxidase subunit IV [Parachlamydiaceae bacterium]|nr:cytochrome o ubiquinol oxidase subunit IV [Parachlamydiaceae bacterium]
MSSELSFKATKEEWHGSYRAYLIGFISSLVLTLTSFTLVLTRYFSNQGTIYLIVSFALVQAVIQLLFFLHVGQEAKPKWETLIFYFMILILIIIAVGSLWVMNDLNERVMNMDEMNMTEEPVHD